MSAKKQTTLSSLFKSPSTISSSASQQETETKRKNKLKLTMEQQGKGVLRRAGKANFPGSELIKGRTSKSSTVR